MEIVVLEKIMVLMRIMVSKWYPKNHDFGGTPQDRDFYKIKGYPKNGYPPARTMVLGAPARTMVLGAPARTMVLGAPEIAVFMAIMISIRIIISRKS